MEFLYTYHPAWIIVCLIVAFGYSFFLYRRDSLLEDVKKSMKWIMAVCRFVAVFLICLLLLSIVLEKLVNKKEKPLVFIVNDNSESIVSNKDSIFYKNEFIDHFSKLSNNLKEKFEVIEYSFADEVSEGLLSDYKGKTTDIAKVFNQIFDQYTNRNIGGIIMASDGVYNVGSNPIYALSRKSFLPVFTIGLGDTNQVQDVKVEYVKHNDIAFIGNQFPIEIGITESEFKGEKVKVGVYKNDQMLFEKEVKFAADDQQITINFDLKASSVGFQKYVVKVTELEGEFSHKNNTSNFYVEVIDGRQKVLIAHNGPHPDIASIRYVIENNKNYEVEVKNIVEIESVSAYDLVIVHNCSSDNSTVNEVIKDGGVPCLYVIGNKTEVSYLARSKIGFTGAKTDLEEVGFKHNPAFKEVLLSPKIIQMLSTAPPLQAPFGNFRFSATNDVLGYQKIGNITLDKPLIYFNRKNSNRYGVIMGEGIWRWRLHDQLKNGTTENFEEFISKLVTFLAIKDNKDPFRIHLNNEYNESQNVTVRAELYNQSFELINEPEVVFKYTKDDKAFEPHFVRQSKAYQLNLGKLEQGIYSWTASTDFQGKHYEKSGTFLVKEIKLEQLNVQANHRLLNNIAQNSNGRFYLPNELNELETDILERDDMVTVVYQEKSFDDLIDYKILFFLIAFVLSLEWFLRKFYGAY